MTEIRKRDMAGNGFPSIIWSITFFFFSFVGFTDCFYYYFFLFEYFVFCSYSDSKLFFVTYQYLFLLLFDSFVDLINQDGLYSLEVRPSSSYAMEAFYSGLSNSCDGGVTVYVFSLEACKLLQWRNWAKKRVVGWISVLAWPNCKEKWGQIQKAYQW